MTEVESLTPPAESGTTSIDTQERFQEWQKRHRDEYWYDFWRNSGISPKHRESLRKKINPRGGALLEAVAACLSFCRQRPLTNGSYLFGEYGSGKTLLACKSLNLVAREAYNQLTDDAWDSPQSPPSCEIVSVPALLARIRATFNGEGEYTSVVVDHYRFRGLLVLDDIGREKPTEWVRDTLFQIIDWRYGHTLPTIFTSNYHLSDLEDRLGMAIADRILEMCKGNIVEITVGSYRGMTA